LWNSLAREREIYGGMVDIRSKQKRTISRNYLPKVSSCVGLGLGLCAWPIRFFLEDKLPSLDFKDANSSWYRILIDPTDLEVVFLLKTNKSMGGFMAYKYARLDPRKPFPSP
jgi:hypothetical protein